MFYSKGNLMSISEVNKIRVIFIIIQLAFNLISCTVIYLPEKPNTVTNSSVSLDRTISHKQKYRDDNSVDTDLLKVRYDEALRIARSKYINALDKADSLGITTSPWLDTCCNNIRKIDLILNENSNIKYCGSISESRF
jgi:cell division protein FtsL